MELICDGDERTEICDLESGAVRLTEKVLGLDIAVEEAVFVHVGQAIQELVHDSLHLPVLEGPVAFPPPVHQVREVRVHELEDEEEVILLQNHLPELDDAGMPQRLERPELAEILAVVPGPQLFLDLFDGDAGPIRGGFVVGHDHHAEGALGTL